MNNISSFNIVCCVVIFFMKDKIIEYINRNIKSIAIITLFIVLGIVIGIFLYQFVSSAIRNDLIQTMKNTLELTKNENFQGINIIKNGMLSNMLLVMVIYLLSLTLLSPYLISLISFLKGLSIGIYIPTLFNIFGMSKGILAMFLLIIIPNLVYIPSYIFLSTNSIKFHYSLISEESKIMVFIKEIIRIILGFSIMFLGVIIEQFASGFVINLYGSI